MGVEAPISQNPKSTSPGHGHCCRQSLLELQIFDYPILSRQTSRYYLVHQAHANGHVDVQVAMHERGVGWTLAGDRQTKACPFTVPKLHHVARKLYNDRKAALDLCRVVGSAETLHQMDDDASPTIQRFPSEIVRKAESKQIAHLFISELIEIANVGKLLHSFPKLQLQSSNSSSTYHLRLDFSVIPDFRRDEGACGGAESFWIQDDDGEVILFHDTFVFRQHCAAELT
ncbi:hypothetical protein ARMSODRAFT_1019358 [Armillaria solidipes]|uniref:Uncharacterized protein n=1 Tax=Armillaria solidipes TaxID=1076256 RepID=A0A2H3C0E8_9AGAR|nr:hypothetical protein ARMSODRAFT_1019358 [Armillaria solidipes]